MTDTAPPRARLLLALAAVAVGFAAADTYVVVTALPDMMTSAGLGLDELQRAAPIVSGFLLGYVAVLPLVGRVADLRGRGPVLVGSLLLFVLGSLVTSVADGLGPMVVGRFVQGVGGGGLVPATLALVADLWPPRRRGVPLGVVGAVQELGSVLGPLYGAAVLAVAGWRAVFVLNAAVGLVLVAAMLAVQDRAPGTDTRTDRPRTDLLGAALALVAVLALLLTLAEPAALRDSVTWGVAFLPLVDAWAWTTPAVLVTVALAVAFVARELTASHPLVAFGTLRSTAREVDVWGTLLLALALGCVVVAFASADPEHAVLSDRTPVLLVVALAAAGAFVWRQRTAAHPLVPAATVRARPAWGSLVVSFFVGVALVAALVDVPFFARVTEHATSQLGAALVLLEFLVALPVGALLGGLATRRVPPSLVAGSGMALAATGLAVMSRWDADALDHPLAVVTLVLAGLGFGLAIAPVNSVLLDTTPASTHGVASSLVVVARMVGMLVGISVLTAWGLRAYHGAVADMPTLSTLCPGEQVACRAYREALVDAGIVQLSTVFQGAAIAAAIAAVAAVTLLRLPGSLRRRGEPG